MTAQAFATEFANGKTYLTTTSRGVEYTACKSSAETGWTVYTNRLSLGRFNAGGVKMFASLDALCVGCKAFGAAEGLVREALA